MGNLRRFLEDEQAEYDAVNGTSFDGLSPELQLRRLSSIALPLLRTITPRLIFLRSINKTYNNRLDTQALLTCWIEEGWVTVSPDGTEMKITSDGEEQLAKWDEEARLWQNDATPPEQPKRLKAGAPATNLQKLASIIGQDQVVAIHDPYFTDPTAVCTLLKLRIMGTAFSDALRILACNHGNRNQRQAILDCIADVNAEQASHWKLLAYQAGEHPHRRFLLLKSGAIITCGMSLNRIDKDEVLDRVSADTELSLHDRQFFDEKWGKARSLIPTT